MTRLTQAVLTFSPFNSESPMRTSVDTLPVALEWLLKECDPDGDGVVDPRHFKTCAIERGIDPVLADVVFRRCDVDSDGALPHRDATICVTGNTRSSSRVRKLLLFTRPKGARGRICGHSASC